MFSLLLIRMSGSRPPRHPPELAACGPCSSGQATGGDPPSGPPPDPPSCGHVRLGEETPSRPLLLEPQSAHSRTLNSKHRPNDPQRRGPKRLAGGGASAATGPAA